MLLTNHRWPVTSYLYEFFFWHCYSEVEMTETAGDHRAQLEVKTLQKQNEMTCNSSFKTQPSTV